MPRQAPSGKRTPLVTTLPPTPIDGQEIRFLADATNGVVWNLRYRAASSSAYKWELIGGSPLYAEVMALETVNSTTYVDLATVGPAVALPLAGDYMVTIGARIWGDQPNSNPVMSYAIGATAAVDADALDHNQVAPAGAFALTASRERRKTGLGAVTLTAKYKRGTVACSLNAMNRWMSVRPVRVG